MAKDEFGIIGLGKIGKNLAYQALEKGLRVVGYTLEGITPDLLSAGLVEVHTLSAMVDMLSPPRTICLYVPAGPAIDDILTELRSGLSLGDIIVDGGNSYWGDSIRRYRSLREIGISFVDLGTSGGMEGARYGACFMAGGDAVAVSSIATIFAKLSCEGGFVYVGPSGTGHFTKVVHNGIEFGMLQAIGEGLDLLKHYPFQLDIAKILQAWTHGSIIRGWLLELMERLYREEGGLEEISSYIEDASMVNWLVGDAIRMEVAIPIIAQSVFQRLLSRDHEKNWARAVAMMRHGLGGHVYGPDKSVMNDRRTGHVMPLSGIDLDGIE